MHLFFIDESGTIPPKDKINVRYFTLGGIIIPENIWQEIDQELIMIKKQAAIVGEIKWRYFSPQKKSSKPNSLSHLNPHQKEELRFGLFNLIIKYTCVRLICTVVDIQLAYNLDYVKNENDLYWYAYLQMIEKFQLHLRDLLVLTGDKFNGIVICDHRQPKDDHQLRLLHQKLLTEWPYNVLSYRNLVEGVFIAPSHLSVGIQLADMVAGAVYRKFVRNDSRYFDLLLGSFKRNLQIGEMEGHGLIKWPNQEAPCRKVSEPASIDAATA